MTLPALLARMRPADRGQLAIFVVSLALLALAWGFIELAGEVLDGDTQAFDERILAGLRRADDPRVPIGPRWLRIAALDVTSLGSGTVLGLTVTAIAGFLLLQGLKRYALFVSVASMGGWLLNAGLKALFARPRPSVVPHLHEVMTLSFPSGHAMTSAAVYLTLGALLMRVAKGRLARVYCMSIAMLATFLIGASRVYLGVHYPTDVLAGWLVGMSWALMCWGVERGLDRRAGLRRERAEART